jgi:long-chain acyl-CoA synthetase
MLYERWREVVRMNAHETAVWDAGSGGRWTFEGLDRLASGGGEAGRSDWVFPEGSGISFLVTLLRGWRAGSVVCPLESGQSPPQFPRPPEGIVHLKTTSATTGAARGVAFRAGQLAADADHIRATMGLRPDWPNLAAISLAHSYGFSNLVLPLLLQGIPVVLCGSGLPEAVRRGAALVPHATLPGVPALWRGWLEADAVPQNIRLAISAGAPLPLVLEQQMFERCGLKLHNFYGATECGGIAYDCSAVPRSDPAVAGQPLEGVSLEVAASGVLQVRGAAVGETYWPEPDSALAQGRYDTSDLAEIEAGLVRLRGRAGDLIHVAGRKLAPEVVERVLLAHPGVQDCLVLGLPSPDDARQEVIAAVIVTTGLLPDESALRAHAQALLPPWQVPRSWFRVDSLRANERGKLSRRAWRERLEG